jgi:hypothetical protein
MQERVVERSKLQVQRCRKKPSQQLISKSDLISLRGSFISAPQCNGSNGIEMTFSLGGSIRLKNNR